MASAGRETEERILSAPSLRGRRGGTKVKKYWNRLDYVG